MIIKRKAGQGKLEISREVTNNETFVYIREKTDPHGGRYRDIQTVCVSMEELKKIQEYVTK